MFDDLKIRNKLILLVAGPIVIIVLLAALGARSRQDTAADSRRVETLVAVAQANSNVVDALQQESIASSTYVGSGREAGKEALAEVRAGTDRALQSSLGLMGGSARATSSSFRSTSSLAIDAADKLAYIRDAVDQGYRWDQVATTYGSVQETFLAVNDTVAEAVVDPQVAGQLRTAGALAAYKAAIARGSSLLVGASQQGGFTAEGSFDLLRAAVAEEENQQSIYTSVADVDRKGQVRDALTSEARIDTEAARDAALALGADGELAVDAAAISTGSTAVLADLHEVETNLFQGVIDQSRSASETAERAANLFLIAAVIAVLAAAVGAVLLGRRITRPLGKLTDAADRLATEQMPRLVESLRNPSEDELGFQLGAMQAIEVSSNDEIGQLASSFNDVQRVAGEVAAEQAALLRKGIGEMFVNLARRNQALLDRQIEFIDELERGEEDPDQLENLYRLDHLATRMRRNAESLLVLAGAEPPRRRGRPAPLANVVRAALAEVEDFGRIELLSFDEVLIASNAAADLAHLLSELMENATNFSPPETRVEVVGHRTKADGYVISVSDHGIGMSADQILEANESLAKPPLVGLALSRSLGFIVVGRLAGRHNVAVRIMPSPAGGVTAVVSIPPSMVTDGPSSGTVAPPAAAAPAEVPSRLKPVMDSAVASGLPPLEFKAFDGEPSAPATLAEAVPSGLAFDQALESLVTPAPSSPASLFAAPPASPEEPPTGPTAHAGSTVQANGLPTRRLTASPAAPRTGPATPAPAPAFDAGRSDEPAASPGLPEPVAFADPGPLADEPAATPGLPEALVFSEASDPTSDGAVPTSARLDGPPPPLPARSKASRPQGAEPPPPVEPAPKPFFLEDSGPPRLFGGPRPEAAPSEPAAAEPLDAAPKAPTRLFGGAPVATPATEPTPPEGDAPPLARRQPPAAASPAADPAASSAPAPAGAERTGAGLAKRVPRQAGATRAIPGSDAERGVSATRRSPDEVRSLLSRYRDGQQRARVTESVPAGPTEEMENHE